MENTLNWDLKTFINELTQGRELVKQLRNHLGLSSLSSTGELLLTKLLSSFDKSLLMLNWVKLEGDQPQLITGPTAVTATELPSSVSGSLRSDSDYDLRDKSKKRKILPRWTEQVRGCPRTGLEGPIDDGYCWRKYGQKDILGAKYPRGYYRCTYRNVQGCLAIKQVQPSDKDPTIFSVRYERRHTCIKASHLIPGKSPNRQNQYQTQKQSKETFHNFQTGFEVKTEDLLDTKEFISSSFSFTSTSPIGCLQKEKHNFSSLTPDNHFMSSFSPPIKSPTASESNCLSPHRMNSFGGQNLLTSESDLHEIILAGTSGSNSPILDLDYLGFPLDFDSHFPFDTSGFFS
ncbi:DNA-binding WRKY [Macleaya cordata]|uniref:DNA-binding WRKY n=1 Tax=Macleaya cordata TaxID=56857 RepID=A0A200Q0R9_MACCD|nr:DNA-binding WRKY [Macleaya cordata]